MKIVNLRIFIFEKKIIRDCFYIISLGLLLHHRLIFTFQVFINYGLIVVIGCPLHPGLNITVYSVTLLSTSIALSVVTIGGFKDCHILGYKTRQYKQFFIPFDDIHVDIVLTMRSWKLSIPKGH